MNRKFMPGDRVFYIRKKNCKTYPAKRFAVEIFYYTKELVAIKLQTPNGETVIKRVDENCLHRIPGLRKEAS